MKGRLAYGLLFLLMVAACTAGEKQPEGVEQWQAEWIGAPWEGESFVPEADHPAPEFRKTFSIESGVKRAVVHVCGLGMFELFLNGRRVGEDYYVPNETTYGIHEEDLSGKGVYETRFKNYRVMYLSYDVSDMLRKGGNEIDAVVGNGWWSAYRKGWIGPFGTPRFICQLEITLRDGSTETIVTDENWSVRKSPIVRNDIYAGEVYDARLEDSGEWLSAVRREAPKGTLEQQHGLADRIMEVLEPKEIKRLEDGSWEVDFDDYVTGRVHLYGIDAPAGTEIELLHPISPEDDKSWVKRAWNGDYVYICKGGGNEEYAPRFNWYTFRKVIVKGWPGELKPRNLRAEVIYTDIRTTGHFDCSNPMLGRINHLFWRTQTDNMHMGVASDCPHREKGAYTGDGQVACVAVMHNFDANAFYRKWLRDMSDCQDTETGYVPNGAPWHPGCGGGVAWGAAMCIIPWEHYLHYGDISVLEEHFDAMRGQLRYMQSWRTEDGIMKMQMCRPGSDKPYYWLNLGEWCPAYGLPDDSLVHTFFLWKCAAYTACAARALGKAEEAAECEALAQSVRDAFHKVFYNPETHSYGHNDGSNVFALHMGVPDEYRADVVESLRAEIEGNGGHLNTGIFGTQLFFDVLCDNGLAEVAYAAMTRTDIPSYGWWLEQDARTMWEYWDGRNSRNHPMFGGGLTWLYTRIAGMQSDPAEPGYRHIIIRPTPVGDLRWASYETLTPLGKASVRWDIKDGRFILKLRVPEGSHASVYLPGSEKAAEVGSGKHKIIGEFKK